MSKERSSYTYYITKSTHENNSFTWKLTENAWLCFLLILHTGAHVNEPLCHQL